jgi:hypothetical protein
VGWIDQQVQRCESLSISCLPKLTSLSSKRLPLLIMRMTVMLLPRNQLTSIDIMSPELCIDHVAFILFTHASSLVSVSLGYSDIKGEINQAPRPSNASFDMTQLTPSSLIMPRLQDLMLEIANGVLLTSLKCDLLYDVNHNTSLYSILLLLIFVRYAYICVSSLDCVVSLPQFVHYHAYAI